MSRTQRQSGFTAIELLITLFVAAAFLVAGYQLFNVVIKDGGQTRAESRAGNVAYDYLRRYTPSASDPCVAQTPLTDQPITVDGLVSTTITVTISCPEFSTTGISKIEATIKYNVPQETLKYSTYVNGSGTPATDVTDGLIDWWKFNGNAKSSVGTADATFNTATLATGQGGSPNTAYSFTNNAYMTFPLSNFPSTINALSLTVWTNASSVTNGSLIMAATDDSNNRLNIHLPYSDNIISWDFGNATVGNGRLQTNYSNPAWFSQWTFWAFVAGSGEGMKIYRNGTLLASTSNYASGGFSRGSKTLDVGRNSNSGPAYWAGTMDDLRIYGRTLSAAEISTLYGLGAK